MPEWGGGMVVEIRVCVLTQTFLNHHHLNHSIKLKILRKIFDSYPYLDTSKFQMRCLINNHRGWKYKWIKGGSGWGTHVNPWLIHVNVWQKPLQYCKVISLQLIKIKGGQKDIWKNQNVKTSTVNMVIILLLSKFLVILYCLGFHSQRPVLSWY